MDSVDFENISQEEFNKLLEQHYLGNYSSLPMTGSQRRLHFGLGVSGIDQMLGTYVETCSTSCSSPDLAPLHSDKVYERDNVYALLDRSKAYLGKRTILNPELAKKIDRRPSYSPNSDSQNSKEKRSAYLSDMFPAVMYSMSSRLKCCSNDDSFTISCISNPKNDNKKAFVSNVSRSNNRWLDPVEQKRLAMQDRARLQRAIAYAYSHGLVPILVTFTMQHHWHSLDELRPVIREARSKMFRGRAGSKLAELIGLQHHVDVFEVTITDDGGFHPHCHSLLFIDRSKVSLFDVLLPKVGESRTPEPPVASNFDEMAFRLFSAAGAQKTCENNSQLANDKDSQSPNPFANIACQFNLDKRSSLLILASISKESINPVEFLLKKRWLSLLKSAVKKHFGEVEFNNFESSYQNALFSHACVVSRYKKGIHKGKVIRCKDGNYLAKILGVADDNQDNASNAAYGVDSELTADSIKDSMIPFDLLRKVSAHNIDMWAEYAISTKGWHKIRFSQGLQGKVDSYFNSHPDKDPLAPKSNLSVEDVLKLDDPSYYYFLNSHLIPTLLEKAAQSPQVAADWISEHGFSVLPRPRPPS